MIRTLQIISIIVSIVPLIKMTKIRKLYCIIPILLIFDFCMVIPTIVELFLGQPDTVYQNFRYAMEDTRTNIIFYSFLIAFQIVCNFEITRIKKKQKNCKYSVGTRTESRIFNKIVSTKYHKEIIFACIIAISCSVVAVLFAPDPGYYLKLHTVYSSMSEAVYEYDSSVISIVQNILLIVIILLKVYDENDSKLLSFTRLICTIGVTLLSQKRTILMLIVGFCLVIDVAFKNKNMKRTIAKYIPAIAVVAFYFWAYAMITEKVSFNNDWYYVINEYFFRTLHTKFSIYAALNPDKIHILDYPGQALLYDLFFFIPRSIWNAKPHNYVYYFIAGLLNSIQVTEKTWVMPTSYYPEFVSNFGLIGLPISILFTISICRYFDKKDNFIKMCGLALIAVLQIYYYDDMLKILAIFICLLIVLQRCSINGKRIL